MGNENIILNVSNLYFDGYICNLSFEANFLFHRFHSSLLSSSTAVSLCDSVVSLSESRREVRTGTL